MWKLLQRSGNAVSVVPRRRWCSPGLSNAVRLSSSQMDPADERVLRKRKFQPQQAADLSEELAGQLPVKSRVVICGGGITGASVAYHLGLRGWGGETLLVEQDRVGGELPWTACGLAGRFEPSYTELKLAEYSIDLIKRLAENGLLRELIEFYECDKRLHFITRTREKANPNYPLSPILSPLPTLS